MTDVAPPLLPEPPTVAVAPNEPIARAARRPARAGFVLLVLLLAVAAGGKAVLFDTLDPDCFWHLKVAEQLLADGVGPIVDRLSFASVQTPWSPYSWLAELGMKALWDAGGYRAAVATQAAMQGLFVLLIAAACVAARPAAPPRAQFLPPADAATGDRGGRTSYLAGAVATAVAGFVSLPYLSFRPVTASLLLLAAAMGLILRDRARGERTRLIWAVPPLAAVTVNLHLNAVFLPAWLGVLWVGAAWERVVVAHPPEQPEACRRAARYFLLTAATAAGCCCTPMLPGMAQTALYYGSADPMVASGYISEMRPFFLGTLGQASAAIVGLALLLVVARLWRFRAGERLLLVVGVVSLSQWGRFAPVFALSLAPMLAVAVGGLSDAALGRWPVRAALAGVLLVATVRVAAEFPPADRPLAAWLNRQGPDAPGYPAEAAAYVAATVTPRTGRVVSEFGWGGYLEWAVGDKFQVLLDGRTQLYSAGFWRAAYLDGEAARTALLAGVEADAAVLPGTSSYFRRALVRQGWRTAWRDADGRAEVLVPPAPPPAAAVAAEPATREKPKRRTLFSAILPE